MRSIFVHICGTSAKDVSAFLSEAFPGQSNPWIYPAPPTDNALYINFAELGSEDMPEVNNVLGKKPDVSIIADVSGRHPGEREVFHFIRTLLTRFTGVVQDDYSDYAWTLKEIDAGHCHLGHPFFDYRGWFDEAKRTK